jgi:hypothetical protein
MTGYRAVLIGGPADGTEVVLPSLTSAYREPPDPGWRAMVGDPPTTVQLSAAVYVLRFDEGGRPRYEYRHLE